MNAPRAAATARDRVVAAMLSCEQSPGVSVLAHGRSVRASYLRLRAAALDGHPPPDWWRVPAWALDPSRWTGLPDDGVMEEYQVHHDCGKPCVLEIDEDGRRRFPGHAAASASIWLSAEAPRSLRR